MYIKFFVADYNPTSIYNLGKQHLYKYSMLIRTMRIHQDIKNEFSLSLL